MKRMDHWEERQWLGGEAHVASPNGRPGAMVLGKWLASELVPPLAGAAAVGVALGSLGTIGIMKMEPHKPRSRTGERDASTSSERSGSMDQIRGNERQARYDEGGAMGAGTVLAAFGLGLLAGALATLLMTPEPGESVRRRVRRGLETARHELDGIVEETKESWSRVRDDAQDAVKRTTTRIKEAAKVTKEAVAEGTPSVPKAQ
jgi:gas vesicle protein